MKPTHEYTGHVTYDLTECKVHCLTDPDGSRRIVAMVPKVTQPTDRQSMQAVNGQTVEMRGHVVKEWEEITLLHLPSSGG